MLYNLNRWYLYNKQILISVQRQHKKKNITGFSYLLYSQFFTHLKFSDFQHQPLFQAIQRNSLNMQIYVIHKFITEILRIEGLFLPSIAMITSRRSSRRYRANPRKEET